MKILIAVLCLYCAWYWGRGALEPNLMSRSDVRWVCFCVAFWLVLTAGALLL